MVFCLSGNFLAFSRSLAPSSCKEDGGGWWSGDWLKLTSLDKQLVISLIPASVPLYSTIQGTQFSALFLPFLLSQASKTKGVSEYEQIFQMNRN